jgi:3-hydroxybutyryl-CoA dehydrogenase
MAGFQVLVAGSGVMGRGIARSFAEAGLATAVLSREPARVAGVDPRVRVLGEPPAAAPELVVESVPEVMELKLELFARLERAWGGAPILASNTSGLPLQEIADRLAHPSRFVGLHYFQPADVAPVVEVARVRQTEEAAFRRAAELVRTSGKRPLLLREPVPGLLINRLQHAILHEAYYLIERGVATAADVDLAAKELLGPRMSVTGLIEQKDISGLDTHALAQAAIVPELHHGAAPLAIVQDKRRRGRIGVKTGVGFYDWRGFDPAYRAKASALLGKVLELLGRERPASPPLAKD